MFHIKLDWYYEWFRKLSKCKPGNFRINQVEKNMAEQVYNNNLQ